MHALRLVGTLLVVPAVLLDFGFRGAAAQLHYLVVPAAVAPPAADAGRVAGSGLRRLEGLPEFEPRECL